jgi:DMSO reductase family type II enzyme heme b subunit
MRRTPRIHGIRVALLHDGERLSVRLRWADPTRDASSLGQAEFRDGAALQFGAGEDPPFFGMGGSGRPGDGAPVPIAMWKADRQEDAGGGSDLEARWPRACADGYPADGSAAGAVVPGLPLSRHDPLYLTGRAAGNGVSDLSGAAAVESLDSRGAGTLGFRRDGAAVEGKGTWKDGTWTVVFRRPLADAGSGGVALVPGGTASIAFAAWDGASGDRNGIKSVTAWHGLVVEEGGR